LQMMQKLQPQRLNAEFAAGEGAAESRTIPMTFYAGATVLQFNWDDGVHELTLSMEPGACDFSLMKGGRAPFTLGHASSNDPLATLGVIENPRIEGGKAKADVRFSKRPEVDSIMADIIDGIMPNVSVGAHLKKIKEVTPDGAAMKQFIATKWAPFAVALVGVGADPNASFAALSAAEFADCEVEGRATGPKENVMDPIINTDPGAGSAPPVITELAMTQAIQEAQTRERQRAAGIREIVATGRLDATLADQHIASGTEIEAFRSVAFAELARRSAENPTHSNHVEITRDAVATFRQGMTEAMLDRGGIVALSADGPGREYRGIAQMGLLALARECAVRMGRNPNRMSPTEIAELGMTSTSDLPYILQSSIEKSLRVGYAAAPSEWKKISAKRMAANFKTQREIMLGMTATLPRVGESGEYKNASVSDGQETWQLYTYGNLLAITRQTIINDDMGALTSIPQLLGRKAGIKESNLMWATLTANGALADSVALFHATHANYTSSGTAISVDSLGVGRQLMRVQTDSGADYIDIAPRYLVVPTAKEQLARQYTSPNFNPVTPGTTNPWAGQLEPIAEPRLDADSATAWYLFADPAVAPVLVYGYLDGNEGVRQESRIGFEIDGLEYKISIDFGTGVIDYRGAYKNVGA
jgi:phage major head subunit gpT-like protein